MKFLKIFFNEKEFCFLILGETGAGSLHLKFVRNLLSCESEVGLRQNSRSNGNFIYFYPLGKDRM